MSSVLHVGQLIGVEALGVLTAGAAVLAAGWRPASRGELTGSGWGVVLTLAMAGGGVAATLGWIVVCRHRGSLRMADLPIAVLIVLATLAGLFFLFINVVYSGGD